MDKSKKIFTPFFHRVAVATGILIFTLIYAIDISSLTNTQDKLLVNPVIWIIIILYPIIIWQEWKEKKKQDAAEQSIVQEKDEEDEEEDETSARMSKKIFLFMVSTLLYLVLMNYIGFIVSTVLYMPFLMWVLGTRSKKVLIILPIVFTILLYFLFSNLLGLPLPQGILGEVF